MHISPIRLQDYELWIFDQFMKFRIRIWMLTCHIEVQATSTFYMEMDYDELAKSRVFLISVPFFWLTGIPFFVGQFLYFLWFTIGFILIYQTTMNKELSKNEYKFWLFNKSRSKFLKWTYINYTASNINKLMQWHVW